MKVKTETFTDPRDGKVYKTVKIGEQVWMAENLNFDCEGSWCYAEKYGRLYDWETAMKVCPPGWHLPSIEEWDELVNFAGGEDALRAKSGWSDYQGKSGNGIDAYGFSALPGGLGSNAMPDGPFHCVGGSGNWWSANEYDSDYAYDQIMGDYDHIYSEFGRRGFGRGYSNKSNLNSVRLGMYALSFIMGFSGKHHLYSVRCVKDKA